MYIFSHINIYDFICFYIYIHVILIFTYVFLFVFKCLITDTSRKILLHLLVHVHKLVLKKWWGADLGGCFFIGIEIMGYMF